MKIQGWEDVKVFFRQLDDDVVTFFGQFCYEVIIESWPSGSHNKIIAWRRPH